MRQIANNLVAQGIDALAAIGGEDTLGVASRIFDLGVGVVGVPKTVDNDLSCTDYCIGFNTTVDIVAEALDRLHTTASAHHRVLVVEVMGRDAGWVAVAGGLAGGADFILVPEASTDVEEVCQHLERRRRMGKDFSIIVAAEGAALDGLEEVADLGETDAFDHPRLDRRNLGELLGREIERRTGFETRVTVLGHLQRGGSPSAYDRIQATRLGVAAMDLIRQGRFGVMPAIVGNIVVPVRLANVVAQTRQVDLELYELAKLFW